MLQAPYMRVLRLPELKGYTTSTEEIAHAVMDQIKSKQTKSAILPIKEIVDIKLHLYFQTSACSLISILFKM